MVIFLPKMDAERQKLLVLLATTRRGKPVNQEAMDLYVNSLVDELDETDNNCMRDYKNLLENSEEARSSVVQFTTRSKTFKEVTSGYRDYALPAIEEERTEDLLREVFSIKSDSQGSNVCASTSTISSYSGSSYSSDYENYYLPKLYLPIHKDPLYLRRRDYYLPEYVATEIYRHNYVDVRPSVESLSEDEYYDPPEYEYTSESQQFYDDDYYYQYEPTYITPRYFEHRPRKHGLPRYFKKPSTSYLGQDFVPQPYHDDVSYNPTFFDRSLPKQMSSASTSTYSEQAPNTSAYFDRLQNRSSSSTTNDEDVFYYGDDVIQENRRNLRPQVPYQDDALYSDESEWPEVYPFRAYP